MGNLQRTDRFCLPPLNYSFTLDCNVYVRSYKAGKRVLEGLRKLYNRLHLKVNEAKSAVASAYGRAFLGYELWCSGGEM